MIRVVLPYHLRNLARVSDEVAVGCRKPGHPWCRARRDRVSLSQLARNDPRSTARCSAAPSSAFSACQEDLSQAAPDTPLPDAVTAGAEPLLIIGAMAGG